MAEPGGYSIGSYALKYSGFIERAPAMPIKVPGGERWLHEIKFDGYRIQVHIKDATVAAPDTAIFFHC